MIDLNDHNARLQLAAQIQSDIDKFCREEFAEDPRTHLGASIIGHECQAYPWNVFRWLKFEAFEGRMLRLFNRGHEEEARFARWLEGIGFKIRLIDPESGEQYRIKGAKGHFGGSLDAILLAPERYQIPAELIFLGEFKTHGDRSFKDLKKKGVVKSKPQHFKQMNSYGRAYGFQFGLYCAVNKNTDELHFEIVKLDFANADDLFRRAEGVVFAQRQPPKIAQTETFITCKTCDFAGICHRGEAPTKNCRSCANASAAEDGQWFCAIHSPTDGFIPKNVIPEGCPAWRRIV